MGLSFDLMSSNPGQFQEVLGPLSSDSPGREMTCIEDQLRARPCLSDARTTWRNRAPRLELHSKEMLDPNFEPSSP